MQTPDKLDVHAAALVADYCRLDYSVLSREYGTIKALSVLALAKYRALLGRFNSKPPEQRYELNGIKPTSQDVEAWEAHKNKIHQID